MSSEQTDTVTKGGAIDRPEGQTSHRWRMTTECEMERLAFANGAQRYYAQQDRIGRDFGLGDTDAARVLIQENLKLLEDYIECNIEGTPFEETVKSLGSAKVALATLTSAFARLKQKATVVSVCETIGKTLEAECWAAGFLKEDEKRAKNIIKGARKKHGSLKYRRQSVRSMAARGGYKVDRWSSELLVKIGNWLLDALLNVSGSVFTLADVEHQYRVKGKDHVETIKVITLTPEASLRVESIAAAMAEACPALLPMVEPPDTWTNLYDGGYKSKAIKKINPLIRGKNKQHRALLNHAVKSGQMQPVFDAVNAIQSVAWSINPRMLALLEWVALEKREVKGLPRWVDYPDPVYPENWDELDKETQKAWRERGAKIKAKNIGLIGQRAVFLSDLETARLFADEPEFYVPHYLDFRGRIYGQSHFNFQRGDAVRSLFLFSEGKPIGEDGMVWLAIHLASTGDFDKMSKKPYAERVQWVNDNLETILDVATNPKGTYEFWRKADKPFLFCAAAMEYAAAMVHGPNYVSRLPVSYDGSCSGLQHLCSLTRSEEAKYVNVIPSDEPQDIYQAVADLVLQQVRNDATKGVPQAQAWLRYGLGRKEVKRGVMTYCYSSRSFGMSEQIIEDLMRPLEDKVLSGQLSEHPFGEGQGYKEAFYMGNLLCNTIEEFIKAPAEAMSFLRQIALALAHESKSPVWTTPTGLPVVSWYPEHNYTRLTLFLHDKGFKVQHKVKIETEGKSDTVRKEKSANGISPNFVHSLDAAHLMLTVNASVSENITQVALVHDSFGCLAADASRWNEIIREQFARLYTDFDVLGEVRAQALKDITQANAHRIPEVPARGTLDIKEIENSTYAFA